VGSMLQTIFFVINGNDMQWLSREDKLDQGRSFYVFLKFMCLKQKSFLYTSNECTYS
jgi:hypothetical protein